ncbi:hypothetical protein [Mesorhizobium sp.]|nr:hypothetical protein [Mesorhizobium sp.]
MECSAEGSSGGAAAAVAA